MSTLEPSTANWRTSSYSGGSGNCIEVAQSPDLVLVRDTKDRDGGTLTLRNIQWQTFLVSTRS